jgi:DNA-binding winged helix-turn-helix (wHTH) protein
VWGYRTFVPTRTVESHASRVRCKLAAAGLPGWIVNVWGVGYSLRPAFLQDVDPVQEVLDPGELGHLDHEHRHEDDENDEPHVFVIAGAAGMGIRDRPDPSDGKATI